MLLHKTYKVYHALTTPEPIFIRVCKRPIYEYFISDMYRNLIKPHTAPSAAHKSHLARAHCPDRNS